MGRFAPSPTGVLHLGSLVAALASYLEARVRGGRWLLRMEDLDTPRLVPGSADSILRTLECLELAWDGEVLWQSGRLDAYAEALRLLEAAGRLYPCDCSRKDVAGPYPGICRGRGRVDGPHALRLRLPDEPALLAFRDRWQGGRQLTAQEIGDPVVRRRDGLYAYQLAVVVDDAHQGVTDVVRGADLLESTHWQLGIGAALGLPRPTYAHVPLVTEPDGHKLAKSRRSVALDERAPGTALAHALRLLGQSPPASLDGAAPREILLWARLNWRPEMLENRAEIAVAR